MLQDVLPLLRALCSLRWQPALTALLARVAEAQQDAPRLLSELFAAPPEAEPLDVQQVAAQQAASLLRQRASAVARSRKAAVQQGECVGQAHNLCVFVGSQAADCHAQQTRLICIRPLLRPAISVCTHPLALSASHSCPQARLAWRCWHAVLPLWPTQTVTCARRLCSARRRVPSWCSRRRAVAFQVRIWNGASAAVCLQLLRAMQDEVGICSLVHVSASSLHMTLPPLLCTLCRCRKQDAGRSPS